MTIFDKSMLNQIHLNNRIIRSATNEHLGNLDGTVSDAYIRTYEELARDEVGLIITSHMTVDSRARADETQICINHPDSYSGIKELIERVRACEGKMIIQLSHAGINASEEINGRKPIGPSAGSNGKEMMKEEIESTVNNFVQAAKYVKDAGGDGVQIHLAHGYLLCEFLDSYYNHREDEYGGSEENRYRIIKEIVKGIRKVCGKDFLLVAKINSTDVAGNDEFINQQMKVCEWLERDGIDAIEVSGHGFATYKQTEPYFLQQALKIKKRVSIPIILVGGFRNRAGMDDALQKGIDYISLSRPFICEPDFMNRLRDGEESRCLNCNQCFSIFRKQYKRCILHTAENQQLIKNFRENEN